MTVKSSRDWSRLPHTHPAAYALNITPAEALGDTIFEPASRGVVFDQSGTVQLEFAGVSNELPAAIVGASGDISAAANGVYTSTTSGKFSSISVGDSVVIKGFSNYTNNAIGQVSAASSESITVLIPGSTKPINTVPETPAGALVSIQDQVKTSVQSLVTVTVVAGVLYPFSIDQWIDNSGGVTTGTLLW